MEARLRLHMWINCIMLIMLKINFFGYITKARLKRKKTIMHAYCSQLSPKAYTLYAFFIVAQGVGVFFVFSPCFGVQCLLFFLALQSSH